MASGCRWAGQSLKPLFLLIMIAVMIFPVNYGLAAEQTGTCTKEILQTVIHASGLSLSELLKSMPDDPERARLIRKFVKAVRFFRTTAAISMSIPSTVWWSDTAACPVWKGRI